MEHFMRVGSLAVILLAAGGWRQRLDDSMTFNVFFAMPEPTMAV
jgi:hypothetical protein